MVGLATSQQGQVAVSVWQRGRVDVAVLKNGLRYLTQDRAQDLDPSWRGEATLLFRSDRVGESFELYALRVADKKLAQLSRTLGGAFMPEAGSGGTWFAALGGDGYNLAWLPDRLPDGATNAPKALPVVKILAVRAPPASPLRPPPAFPVAPYKPLDSLRPYGWLPTNAGGSLSPLGVFAEFSLVAQDDSLDHNLRATFGFDSGRAALAGFYGFLRYDFGSSLGLALQATPPPLRYAVQLGVWPLTPHLGAARNTVAGAKASVGARLPEDRLMLSWGLEAGLVHVLGQPSGIVLDARADGAVAAGQADTWGYSTEGWRVSATGLVSATGAAPSLGAWLDGGYTLPLGPLAGPFSVLGRLEFGVRAGYRPAWPVPLRTDADFAALVSVGAARSFPLKLRVGDGLYALERVTLEPRLRSWLDSTLHLGGDLTVSLDSVLGYGAPVSFSGTLGYTSGVWTRFAVAFTALEINSNEYRAMRFQLFTHCSLLSRPTSYSQRAALRCSRRFSVKLRYGFVALAPAFLLTLLIACSSPVATLPSVPGGTTSPRLPNLTAGQWTAFSPGGDTRCSDGSPYTYYVRPGTVNKLVVDFEGGGACWSGGTCGGATPVYQPNIASSQSPPYRVTNPSGLYDHTNANNPVKDWYHVFISYCTADIHLGDSVQIYTTASGPKKVYHNGQKNVAAVLSWVEKSLSAPEAVFVTGCSAGAYGAAFYTPRIAAAYPNAAVTELGDCSAGVIPDSFVTDTDGLKRWNISAVLPPGVDLSGGVPTTFLVDAYVAIGKAYPKVTLAEYNSQYDGTQTYFYALQSGLDLSNPTAQQAAAQAWAAGLKTSLTKIQTNLPGSFSSYTSLLDTDNDLTNGTAHCVITRPEFYTLTTNGVSFVDWLNSLLNDPAPPAPVVPTFGLSGRICRV